MAELDIGKSTYTDMTNLSNFDYSVDSVSLDTAQKDETIYTFPKARKYMGYYKTIPELKKAIDSLSIYVVGLGHNVKVGNVIDLDAIQDWGEGTFLNVLWNMQVLKKIHGDAFAEIIRDKSSNRLLNIKVLDTAQMAIICDKKGMIKRYEQRTASKIIKYEPEEILHLSNDRVGSEIHGVSVVQSCEWVILARNEALEDEKKIKHRELALGVMYVDTENDTKLAAAKSAYANAVKNGEVLVLPEKTAKLEAPKGTASDRLAWIQYLEGFFYQAVGVNRTIANGEGVGSEGAAKVGFLAFEPIYSWEQKQLEQDLWQQLGIRIEFNRPPSLRTEMQENEAKNTSQTSFQPKETEYVNMERE